MFSLTPIPLLPPPVRGTQRILRSLPDSFLLASLSRDTTSILLLKDSRTTTVLSFKQNVDILNASLSDDNELIHVTERFTDASTRRICYRSAIYDVQGMGQTSELFYSFPLDGLFVGKPDHYHVILYLDSKILNFQVYRTRKGIERKARATISNVIWMTYWPHSLSLVQETGKTFSLQFLEPSSTYAWATVATRRVPVQESACLPWQMSLIPLNDYLLPIFRYSRYRFILAQHHSKLCFIQQVFGRQYSELVFHISLTPTQFSEFVVIPGAAPDIPICSARFADLILLFAPHSFVCVIDLRSKRPGIAVLPKCFAPSECGLCAESLSRKNSLIDLDSGEAYQMKMSFQSLHLYEAQVDRKALAAFACLSQRLRDVEIIAQLLHFLETRGDHLDLIEFFRVFFGQLPQFPAATVPRRPPVRIPEQFEELVDNMESEFPSLSTVPRHDFYREQLAVRKRITEKSFEKCYQMLKDQNSTVMVLRAAVGRWVTQKQPSRFWQTVITLIVHLESMVAHCPEGRRLKQDLPKWDELPASREIKHRLMHFRVFEGKVASEVPELEYWKVRLGSWEAKITDFNRVSPNGDPSSAN
jgi:hypothetical protein